MKNQVLAALAVIIVLTAFYVNVGNASPLQSSVILSSSGVVQQTSTGTYSYIISVSGSNYQMTNGTTGQIVFQSTSSSQVFSNVVGNCSAGSSIDVESGVYTVNTMWLISGVNGITLNFENGAKLVAGNSLNSPVLFISSNNIVINGIVINGNAENQVAQISGNVLTSPNGIFIGGSNDEVNNALIYNVRMVGVEIWGYPLGGAVHSGVINSKIYNCGWNGITIGDVNDYAINNEIYGCSDVGISTYGVGTQITGNYIHDLNGTTGGGGNSLWGIAVEGGYGNLISGNYIDNVGSGIVCSNSGHLASGTCNNNTISGNTITNSNSTGIFLESSYNIVDNNHITRVNFDTAGWIGDGIHLTGSTFNEITGNYVSQCDGDGIYLDAASNNNTVSLNYVFDNNVPALYYGTAGINIAGDSNYISQNQVFDTRSGAARTQQYGIAMKLGASNNILIGNNGYNNVNNNIADTNVPENTMINNIGYNPVGHIARPISGNTAYLVDSGSSSTWISGRVYTNTGSPKVLNISAGTVSIVAQNGVTLFTATGCTVTLQPGDTFSVTFSTAPTINVIGQ